VALMTPAKLSGETCQGVVGCRFVATHNYRSTYSISIGSPLSSLAGTPRTLASCELDAELVTNAASASRTSSADIFLRGSSASTKSKKRSAYGSNAARTSNRSRRPSFCLLLWFIAERPASAQKQTSGWTSRISAPGPGSPRSKSSTPPNLPAYPPTLFGYASAGPSLLLSTWLPLLLLNDGRAGRG
jgi:hypothetical protein